MELRAEIMINAPADAAWAVVGEGFGQIGQWAVPITASSMDGELAIGAIRTCQVASFGPFAPGVVEERLMVFDPNAMSLEYDSTAGLPAFVRSAVNRWSVHAQSEMTCLVRMARDARATRTNATAGRVCRSEATRRSCSRPARVAVVGRQN